MAYRRRHYGQKAAPSLVHGLALSAALLSAGQAAAGPWTQNKGDGVAIVSIGRQGGPLSALTLPAEEGEKASAQVYAEYGVSDGTTLGGSFFTDITPSTGEGSASITAFGRQRIWSTDASIASIQIGGSYPVESLIGTDFAESRPDSTPELRASVLAGTGWWGDWGRAFGAATVGFAWRSEGADDEVRGELTGGYAPWDCCLAILSVYSTVTVDGEDPSLKIAPSLAYTFGPSTEANALKDEAPFKPWTISAGVSQDVLGDDDFGVTFSLWKKF
ncbi:MAG: hypothetical protein AAF675_10385 [Pseudomonadota bacterium]